MEQSSLCYAALEYIHSLLAARRKKRGKRREKGEQGMSGRELFWMLTFPPLPDSYDDLLEHAGNRYSEEPTEQSEEFCAGEEREKGHNGMNPDCSAEDAWCQDLPQDNPHEQRHKNSHGEHHHPSLWYSRQDTQRRYHKGAYHRDKVEQKEERSQQSGIRDAQQRQYNAGTQGPCQREQ